MKIGMAITVPKTAEEFQRLRKIVLLLDEAALIAVGAGLTIQGADAPEFLGALTEQIMQTLRRNNEVKR